MALKVRYTAPQVYSHGCTVSKGRILYIAVKNNKATVGEIWQKTP